MRAFFWYLLFSLPLGIAVPTWLLASGKAPELSHSDKRCKVSNIINVGPKHNPDFGHNFDSNNVRLRKEFPNAMLCCRSAAAWLRMKFSDWALPSFAVSRRGWMWCKMQRETPLPRMPRVKSTWSTWYSCESHNGQRLVNRTIFFSNGVLHRRASCSCG